MFAEGLMLPLSHGGDVSAIFPLLSVMIASFNVFMTFLLLSGLH